MKVKQQKIHKENVKIQATGICLQRSFLCLEPTHKKQYGSTNLSLNGLSSLYPKSCVNKSITSLVAITRMLSGFQ